MTLAEGTDLPDGAPKQADVVVGEDWIGSGDAVQTELRDSRDKRSFITLHSSPLARKIITFNLIALILLVVGVLYVDPFRESLVLQRERGLITEARLVADVFEAQLAVTDPPVLGGEGKLIPAQTLGLLDLPRGVDVYVFGRDGVLLATTEGLERSGGIAATGASEVREPWLTEAFSRGLNWLAGLFGTDSIGTVRPDVRSQLQRSVESALGNSTDLRFMRTPEGGRAYSAVTPITLDGQVAGAVGVLTSDAEIARYVRNEREQVLRMFLIAMVVSVGLSLVLASTIANPLSDLALAAELGRDKNARKMSPSRIRIPDLTARPDEIGRLSGALRGMVVALYDRIDANEQFAADVSHEIKNPLASLRSAVGTLRVAKKDEHRQKLLDVIEHDVRRLDRLVSDISNASRLDSELVKEDEERFDLLRMLGHIVEYHGQLAEKNGVDFISDMPNEPIFIDGLEGRLAQVFVNLVTNALSFCEAGDAVRIWVRRRENRVLVVVEDTGPGIPDGALSKVFTRFYSERPEQQFGDHSGLGLAISKQIVEAHGGVIWAENIRPTSADVTSQPLGARFVVGLPV